MRGVLALHAAAVVLDGLAIAFVGPSGAGKSTTAAVLSLAGARVLTEDLLALTGVEGDGQVAAHPGFASIRLWPDGASLLGLSSLSRVTANWNKLELPVAPPAEGVPLGLVYLLDVDPSCAKSVSAPLPAATVLLELVASTYVSHLLRRADSGKTLVRLGAPALRVPVRRLLMGHPRSAARRPRHPGAHRGVVARRRRGSHGAALRVRALRGTRVCRRVLCHLAGVDGSIDRKRRAAPPHRHAIPRRFTRRWRDAQPARAGPVRWCDGGHRRPQGRQSVRAR